MGDVPANFEPTWAVVELMGHRKIAGLVSEQVVGGTSIMRVDSPGPGDKLTTQYYGWQSLYCLTPTTEEIARAYAVHNQVQPVHPWELPPALPAGAVRDPMRAGGVPADQFDDDTDDFGQDEEDPDEEDDFAERVS